MNKARFAQLSTEKLKEILAEKLSDPVIDADGILEIAEILKERASHDPVGITPAMMAAWERFRRETEALRDTAD